MKIKGATLFLVIIIVCAKQVFACNCIGKSTIKGEVKNADAVVMGTILNKQIIRFEDSTLYKMFQVDTLNRNARIRITKVARYELLVEESYKGGITKDTIVIFSGLGGGDCGVNFNVGKKYIVYGNNETYFGQLYNDIIFPKGNNIYWTNICMRTNLYSKVEIEEIKLITK